MITFDYNFVTTITSTIALVVAIFALVIETRRERLSTQINILLNLSAQLDSPQIRTCRKRAAENLLNKESLNDELTDVLGFLSTIAFLYERKAIDTDLAYKEFSYWMIGYWLCAHEHVQTARGIVPSLWGTLERSVNKMLLKEKRAGSPPYTEEFLNKFLVHEARLKDYTFKTG